MFEDITLARESKVVRSNFETVSIVRKYRYRKSAGYYVH
jgi:hypothetical protein